MRSLTRIGIAVTAAALASATALAGAGVAGAESGQTKPVFDSASSVSVSGKGKDTTVSYTNKSGSDLTCLGFAGPSALLGQMYDYYRSVDVNDPGDVPAALDAAVTKAGAEGKLGIYGGPVENGKTAALSAGAGGTTVNGTLTNRSFAPGALVLCYGADDQGQRFVEVEVTPGVGVPAGLGSLDGALAGIGSSGSVAQTTGSLGS